ncbi:MAG: Lipid carrier : UDP-N-acetylgalactosaminyltransferase (EC [uncultured Sulfurovum sp.]|uniref:Lipid carrier: UDP-N-acetylgalactosaminyltransferase (EC) n=1 Tax=uncultured Sulfurovum sp. TaxID=269237 RepID=A0A6S6TCB1_9BACT|nr:MAG: Lipid carrier : UDP-N-acetylgalactosaminyltransferase (EC [uncultured Sulfurovum sp.]
MTRIFDIVLSALALIILAPLLLPIMLILKFTGENKVFYLQERVGLNGKMFGIWKFATMLENSPNMKNAYITTHGDPRVLPFGRFLRKSKINELPQLVNIFKGDISVVGPRPQVKAHLDLYPNDALDDILAIKPGLTGIASLFFRDEETMISNSDMEPKKFYKAYIAPYKTELELWYKVNQNLYTYFMLIGLTAWNIFFTDSKLYRKVFRDLPEPPAELVIGEK